MSIMSSIHTFVMLPNRSANMKSQPCPVQTTSIITSLMIKLPSRLGRSKRSVNEQTRINLYKYVKGRTFPLISSLLSFCYTLEIDPGWFVMIACKIQQGALTEDQALDILADFKSHRKAISMVSEVAFGEMLKDIPVPTY